MSRRKNSGQNEQIILATGNSLIDRVKHASLVYIMSPAEPDKQLFRDYIYQDEFDVYKRMFGKHFKIIKRMPPYKRPNMAAIAEMLKEEPAWVKQTMKRM